MITVLVIAVVLLLILLGGVLWYFLVHKASTQIQPGPLLVPNASAGHFPSEPKLVAAPFETIDARSAPPLDTEPGTDDNIA